MNTRICEGCDGYGSFSHQMAKNHAVLTGGDRKAHTDGGPPGFYYVTKDGREIKYQLVGGVCGVCKGAGFTHLS